jgi:hypothetical protein
VANRGGVAGGEKVNDKTNLDNDGPARGAILGGNTDRASARPGDTDGLVTALGAAVNGQSKNTSGESFPDLSVSVRSVATAPLVADRYGYVASSPSVANDNYADALTDVADSDSLDTATRGELPVTVTKQTVATRGKSKPVVEAGKGSKGTWQLRLRWNSEPGRPVHYVATVADSTYDLIRKGDYEAYKRSLIAEYEASAVSADHAD